MADARALLLEDDPAVAPVVRAWLAAAGFEVDVAADGVEGLRRFAEARHALVVSDVLLPGLDGTSLCAHLRLLPFGDRARVVLVSSRAHAREAALAAGADAFVPKPLRREELLAALAVPPRAGPADAEPVLPGAVRVPRVEVLGEATAPIPREAGALGPGVFVPLLRRLHAAGFSGVLEAEGDDGLRAKLLFARGAPAAARSNDAGTGFGQVLLRLGIVTAEPLEACVEEGRRSGLPLGEVLLRSGLVERRALERALREQVLLRAVGVGRVASGRYVLDSADPFGLAGFDVHPAAVAWRLDEAAAPLTESELAAFVRPGPGFVPMWPLLDPDNDLGVLRALLVGGAAVGDCLRVCGPRAGALLATLRAWDVVSLCADPPSAAHREAGLAELDATGFAEELRALHRTLLDANHYTVLGLQPDADGDEIAAAGAAAFARLHPDALPAGLDAPSRARARAVYERAIEAGRVLADPGRRAIYDARLRGESVVAHGRVDVEDHAVLQAERAGELLRRGEHVVAAALFRLATVLEGESPDLLSMLGWARHRACPEDPTAGEPDLRRAVALAPEDENVAYHLARLLADRGDLDEARRLLRRAIELNHEFEPARQALRELPE